MSAAILSAVFTAESGPGIGELRYFRLTRGQIAGVPVEISRTGYTGDLGYEIWMPWARAVDVWDVLMTAGAPLRLRPAGLLALDVARVEAGLLLIDVDFASCRKAVVAAQTYSPFEMGLDRLVRLEKPAFVGRQALIAERRRGVDRRIVGLEVDWPSVEAVYARAGIVPQIAATTSPKRRSRTSNAVTWKPSTPAATRC
jgi:aminomethyltransferase